MYITGVQFYTKFTEPKENPLVLPIHSIHLLSLLCKGNKRMRRFSPELWYGSTNVDGVNRSTPVSDSRHRKDVVTPTCGPD